MPQLDKVTFFAQVTWSLASYLFLYLLFSVHIAPAIGRVLKVRSKINLGGSADSQSSVKPFTLAVSHIPTVVVLAPATFLKTADIASKVAVSSVTGVLSEHN